MSEDIDGGVETTAPIWPVFADLMSVLLGAFMLILVGVIGVQLELSSKLEHEVKQRQLETQRRKTLEQALAGPLAAGRVTLVNGRIGINGSVLFALNSDQLQPEGRDVLKSLAGPLTAYLQANDQILMVSGFTDDRQLREGNRRFADNWELSAQRALTVTRALIDDGRALLLGIRGRIRFATARELECRQRRTGKEPASGNSACPEAVERNGEVR